MLRILSCQVFISSALILPIIGCASQEQIAKNRAESEKSNTSLQATAERDKSEIRIKLANSFVGLIKKINIGRDNFVIQHKSTVYSSAEISEPKAYNYKEFSGATITGVMYCVRIKRTRVVKSPFRSEEETHSDFITGDSGFKIEGDAGQRIYSSSTTSASLRICEPKNPQPFPELEKLLPLVNRL